MLNRRKLVCSRTSKKRKDEITWPFSILYFHLFNIQGPYVVNLTKCLVTSLEEVQRWLAVGNRKRVVASTSQNKRSSRSHVIFTILLWQRKLFSIDFYFYTCFIECVSILFQMCRFPRNNRRATARS